VSGSPRRKETKKRLDTLTMQFVSIENAPHNAHFASDK
jgi:hypothetical protein